MADNEFDDLEQFAKFVQPKANRVLQHQVGNLIRKTIHDHVEDDVYIYKPKQYERHYLRGELGLSSMENMIVNPIENGIEVEDHTIHNGKDISKVVITASGYDYTGYGYDYEQPRSFIENASNELEETGSYLKTFKGGMKEEGIDMILE